MTTSVHSRRDLLACAAGLTLTGAACVVAGRHPAHEEHIFALLNDHRDEPVIMRGLQQAGTPWVLPLTAGAALLSGKRRLAAAAALALPVEKALEVGIKKARPLPRPLYVRPTVLRDDAPVEGESFPSGHAAIATAAACLLAHYVPSPARAPLYALALGAGLVRVSQGAHHPVDTVGGAAMGLAVATGLRFAVGR